MKILFADDMKMMRDLVRDILERRGHIVETVTDGDELLEKLASGSRPDLVITDNNMIRVNGTDVLWRIRNDERFNDIKTMLVIVYSGDNIREKVEKFGGMFVQKMVKVDDLFACVDEVAAEIAKKNG